MEQKLSDEQAAAILRDDRPKLVIAEAFGVSRSLVQQIKSGRHRPHLYEAWKAEQPIDTAEWRSIPDWPMYEASDDGRIRNAKTLATLSQRKNPLGVYWVVDLHTGKRYGLIGQSRQTTKPVHQLVCAAFHGPRPEGLEVAHRNGNGLDNRQDNLRWDTRSANHADKVEHGTNNDGEANGSAKLTTDQVREIRALKGHRSQSAIGRQFGISQQQVGRIQSGVKWRRIT